MLIICAPRAALDDGLPKRLRNYLESAPVTIQSSEEAVVHDAQARQFRVGDGADAAVLRYQIARGRIMFMHTNVPDALRGRGLAQKLAHAGLEYAKAEGLPVVVFCPFVRAYLAKHPEYQSLVVG